MIVNCQRGVKIAISPLSAFLEKVRRALRFPRESIAVQLISGAAMARLNRTFRNKEGSTDVLSFPATAESPRRLKRARTRAASSNGRESYVGDIAIAPQTARRNARLYSRSLDEELRILILHGMIHLAGYDHEADQGQMDRIERRLRRRFRLSLS